MPLSGIATALLSISALGLIAQPASNRDVLTARLSAIEPLTPAEIADLEGRLRVNADDAASRLRLLHYYLEYPSPDPAVRTARLAHILWLIENRPSDVGKAGRYAQLSSRRGPYADPGDYLAATQAWERALAQHAGNADLHTAAARFLFEENPDRAEEILVRYLQIQPDSRTPAVTLGFLYACDILGLSGPFTVATRPPAEQQQIAARARAALEQTSNGHVLAGAATAIPNLFTRTPAARQPDSDRAPFMLASSLMARARGLLPPDSMGPQGLVAELNEFQTGADAATAPAPAVLSVSSQEPRRLRIGAVVQAAKLIDKPVADYPPVARDARLQGTVRFEIDISPQGVVENARLVAGHPLLVPSATQAVLRYRYQPTLLNGTPIGVTTQVDIPFLLGN